MLNCTELDTSPTGILLITFQLVPANDADPNNEPVNEPVYEPVPNCKELDTSPVGILLMTFQLVPANDADPCNEPVKPSVPLTDLLNSSVRGIT